ncbi:hypothetical protein ACJJTC_007015 [Scirpophaga incertulas]
MKRHHLSGAQKRKQAELKKKKTDALPKLTSFFPSNHTTGTSDDHIDDDELICEIKTPVPDKSEPVIVAIPDVSEIELVNSNKKTDFLRKIFAIGLTMVQKIVSTIRAHFVNHAVHMLVVKESVFAHHDYFSVKKPTVKHINGNGYCIQKQKDLCIALFASCLVTNPSPQRLANLQLTDLVIGEM